MKKYNSLDELFDDFNNRLDVDRYHSMIYPMNLSPDDRLEFYAACYDLFPRIYEKYSDYLYKEDGKHHSEWTRHPFEIVTGIYNADWVEPMWIIHLTDIDVLVEVYGSNVFVDAPEF